MDFKSCIKTENGRVKWCDTCYHLTTQYHDICKMKQSTWLQSLTYLNINLQIISIFWALLNKKACRENKLQLNDDINLFENKTYLLFYVDIWPSKELHVCFRFLRWNFSSRIYVSENCPLTRKYIIYKVLFGIWSIYRVHNYWAVGRIFFFLKRPLGS